MNPISHKRLLLVALCLALATIGAGGADGPRPVVFRTKTMGTWGSLTLVTADSAAIADLAYTTLKTFHRVDSLMSNWTDRSEVARINREAGHVDVAVQAEVAGVIACADTIMRESTGAFDITVEPLVRLWGFLGGTPAIPTPAQVAAVLPRVGPGRMRYNAATATIRFAREDVAIDLGGIAKGYGVDAAARRLRLAGVRNALLDLSGNMVAIGNAATHRGWTVGIRDPSGVNPYLARIRLENEAVATSGDYEQFVDADGKRYGHILDPRTGWSARGLTSVTVVASRGIVADAWATAFFVLGPQAARELAHAREDLSVVLVEPAANGDVILWVETQLRERFSLEDHLIGVHAVRFF